MNSFFKILIFFLLIYSFLLVANYSLATTCDCTSGLCCDGCNYKPDTDVCNTHYATDYGCPDGTGCGQDVKVRYKQQYCPGDGPDCTGDVDASWGSWSLADNCETWETCTDDDSTCNCTGNCLSTPQNPRYYNDPNLPTDPDNPEAGMSSTSVLLPVKLYWDPVEGANSYQYEVGIGKLYLFLKVDKSVFTNGGNWQKAYDDCQSGWTGCTHWLPIAAGTDAEEVGENLEYSFQTYCQAETVTLAKEDSSYYYFSCLKEEGEGVTDFTTEPGITFPACTLKSGSYNDWRVSPCCAADGECKDWDKVTIWNFTTNAAPELISPADPDWESTSEKAEDVALPVSLQWCRVEKINSENVYSYNLLPYLIKNEGQECLPGRKSDSVCAPITISYPPVKKKDSIEYIEYSDELSGLFTKLSSYGWQISPCKTGFGGECSDYSQVWGFTTADATLGEISWFSPSDGSTVGFPLNLQWKPPWGANSFQYELYKGTTEVASGKTTNLSVDVTSKLELDTNYKWRVQSCWDYEENDCEDWPSTWWTFKTTGAKPTLSSPAADATGVVIPVKLDWSNVAGAGSYKYEVASDSAFTGILIPETKVENSEVSIDYPPLRMFTNYWWQVKTCADKNGNNCGDFATPQKFTTFKLGIPTNPSPANNGQLFTSDKYLSWNPVSEAEAYQYTIDYLQLSSEEKSENCPGLVGEKIIQNTTLPSNSVYPSLECLGKYQWSVRPCLDRNCQETRDDLWVDPPWIFYLVQPTPVGKAGLVPCGRTTDYPETPWIESEPCQFKHIFILLRNIVDLILWRVGLVILVLLAIATAVIYYFSMGAPATIVNVKSIWRTAGMGYGILFLAWLIVNLILIILGYKVGILGKWWEIKF